jgi:hypothetical protein
VSGELTLGFVASTSPASMAAPSPSIPTIPLGSTSRSAGKNSMLYRNGCTNSPMRARCGSRNLPWLDPEIFKPSYTSDRYREWLVEWLVQEVISYLFPHGSMGR